MSPDWGMEDRASERTGALSDAVWGKRTEGKSKGRMRLKHIRPLSRSSFFHHFCNQKACGDAQYADDYHFQGIPDHLSEQRLKVAHVFHPQIVSQYQENAGHIQEQQPAAVFILSDNTEQIVDEKYKLNGKRRHKLTFPERSQAHGLHSEDDSGARFQMTGHIQDEWHEINVQEKGNAAEEVFAFARGRLSSAADTG